MVESMDSKKEKNKEISEIYVIFKEIYSKAPLILRDLSDESVDLDYKECTNNHIDFKKIENAFQEEKYNSMTDAINDIRLTFLNCYTFYGTKSDHTLKTLQIEELLEKEITKLDKCYIKLTDIQLTLNSLNIKRDSSYKFRYPKNCYDSILLRSVAHCRPERLKEYHIIYSTKLTTNDDNVQILEEIMNWEKEIYFNNHYRYISSMWELPEIGNFLSILSEEFDFDVISQGEIERMFLIPNESITMGKVMTILLTPFKKKKIFDHQVLPYKMWSEKLCKKVSEWYKVYHENGRNKVNVFSSIGIHPDFWKIIGDTNLLVKFDYCELSYLIKVWLLKGLCDYVFTKNKTINYIITNCCERQSTIWKNKNNTEEYFFFKRMPDLRIYYSQMNHNEPGLEFLVTEEIKGNTDITPICGNSTVFETKSRIKPNENNFKLIADSVQGLRSFVNELDTEDSSVPEDLISSFEDFIVKIEPEETNLIVLNNNSKIKTFKDWKSYKEKFSTEKNKIILKQNKISSIGDGGEILGKRKRKTVSYKNLNIGTTEELSDEEFICDYSDSEDEWGISNQPKIKTKRKLPSEINKLEKELQKKNEIFKQAISDNDIFDNFKTAKNPDDLKIKNDILKNDPKTLMNTTIKKSSFNKINSPAKKCNEGLVCSENASKIKIEISSDEEVVFIDSENEEKEKNLVNNKKCINENQSEVKKIKISVSKANETVILDDEEKSKNVKEVKTVIYNQPVKTKNIVKNHDFAKNTSNKFGLKTNEVKSIQDDKQIIISDDEDDVQIVSISKTPDKNTRFINNKFHSNKSNKSFIPALRKRRMLINNCTKRQVSYYSNLPKISPDISIMPANVHLPKGTEVTMVNGPRNNIQSHFNSVKRPTNVLNNYLKNIPSEVNVNCKVISKPDLNGEVKFFVSLPNGKHHPVSDELMNQYLKDNNNILPDYLIVPLSIDVAKKYGFEL